MRTRIASQAVLYTERSNAVTWASSAYRAVSTIVVPLALAVLGTTSHAQRAPGAPVARIDNVTETHHGVAVVDPYRYLEDVKRPEVQAWMQGQSDATSAALARIEGRDALAARLDEVTAAVGDSVRGVMRMPGERYYYLKRARGESQFRLVMREGLDDSERSLVNPEVQSRATGIPHAINFFQPSWDGRFIAFGLSAGGSEDASLYVMDTKKGKVVGQPVPRVQYSPVHWLPDNRHFTVTQLQRLKAGQSETEVFKDARVLLLRVGAPTAQARPVFGRMVTRGLGLEPLDYAELIVVPSSPWVLARTTDTTVPEGKLFVAPLAQLGKVGTRWQRIATAQDQITQVGLRGDSLFFLTYAGAPRRKLMELNLAAAGEPNLNRATQVVGEPAKGVLEDFQLKREGLVTEVRQGTAVVLRHHARGDAAGRDLPQPERGAASLINEPAALDESVLFSHAGWTRWRQHFAVRDGQLSPVVFGAEPALPALDLQVTEIEVPSHDGVFVPMTVVHKKGLELNGRNPVLVEGYASYGFSISAHYTPANRVWLERGGVLAITNPRGSGVYGNEWHRAGFKSTKANTWKDGIACVRWLIEKGYGSPATMAIKGTSAGGIFVGRAVTEAPELFAAAIFEVGALDSLRFEFTANGVTNISEFGTVAKADEFRALTHTSTYHNIKNGTPYPAVMLVHGVNDTRVSVWESSKTAARLQAATSSSKPVLLRLDMQAGHGIGSTLTQRNSQAADEQAFLLQQMGKMGRRD
jgi:prolyl oligopeptidase